MNDERRPRIEIPGRRIHLHFKTFEELITRFSKIKQTGCHRESQLKPGTFPIFRKTKCDSGVLLRSNHRFAQGFNFTGYRAVNDLVAYADDQTT